MTGITGWFEDPKAQPADRLVLVCQVVHPHPASSSLNVGSRVALAKSQLGDGPLWLLMEGPQALPPLPTGVKHETLGGRPAPWPAPWPAPALPG